MLYVIVGRSGSGKTVVTEALCKEFGYKTVWSYTTRPKRKPNEEGHIFISKAQYDALEDKIAPVCYKGDYYCSTRSQLLNSDIYVAEPSAIDELLKEKIPFEVICFRVKEETSIERMRNRGNSEKQIEERVKTDRVVFSETDSIMNPEVGYKKLQDKITYISAEVSIEQVKDKVSKIIKGEKQ